MAQEQDRRVKLGFRGGAMAGLLMVAACSSVDDEAEDLGETVAVDLDQLFQTIEETATAAAELDPTQETTEVDCWASTGDCEACSSYVGTSGQGTFSASMTEIPCGEVWETNARTRTYTVEESALSGSWTLGDPGVYDWSVEGSQSVEYVVEGPAPADRVYDASWELDSLVATTVDGAVGAYDFSATYVGYADLTTRVDITWTADDGEGTVVFEDDDNDQVTCTLTREDEIVTVVCD